MTWLIIACVPIFLLVVPVAVVFMLLLLPFCSIDTPRIHTLDSTKVCQKTFLHGVFFFHYVLPMEACSKDIQSSFRYRNLQVDISAYHINNIDCSLKLTKVNTQKITHTRLTAPFPGLPGLDGTREVKPIWILLKQETVSGSGISWAICKSALASDR